MKITEHNQEGSLPYKMVHWPVNLAEAKALADKYDELAEAGGFTNRWILYVVTGFGASNDCTLCKSVKTIVWKEPDCRKCLYHITNIGSTPCAYGTSGESYDALAALPSPENLRNRAYYIRSVIKRFE